MKTLFNYSNSKIVVRVNNQPVVFQPNSTITVDDDYGAFLLKFNNIKEIQTTQIVVEPKQTNKTDEIIKDIIEEEKEEKETKKKSRKKKE